MDPPWGRGWSALRLRVFMAELLQLAAMDFYAPTTMNNAEKCNTQFELQVLVNYQNFERTLHLRDMPEGIPS